VTCRQTPEGFWCPLWVKARHRKRRFCDFVLWWRRSRSKQQGLFRYTRGPYPSQAPTVELALFAHKPPEQSIARRHFYHYTVGLDREVIVSDSDDPEHDAARELLNRRRYRQGVLRLEFGDGTWKFGGGYAPVAAPPPAAEPLKLASY